MITKEEAIKAYEDLIQLRRSRILIKDKSNLGSIEIHHILPISCGGIDNDENKIALYAKEHFMAHVYLWIIHHEDEFHYQTACALNNMIKGTLNGSRKELRDFILVSEEYQKAKEEFAQYNSETIGQKISGEKNGMFGKCWIKNTLTNETKIWKKGESLPEGWTYGKIQSKTEKVLQQLKKFSKSGIGKAWIYNPLTKQKKQIRKGEIIPDGFVTGNGPRTEEEKQQISKTLKSRITNNPQHISQKIKFLKPRHFYYLEFGFKEMKLKFEYPYSFPNFIKQCKKYLPEYEKYTRKENNNFGK